MKRRLRRILHDRAGYTGLPLAFKGVLILGMATIAGVLIYSTHALVSELKKSEGRLAKAYAGHWKRAAESTDPSEIGYLFDQIILRSDFPIVVADPQGQPLYWRGLPDIDDHDTTATTRHRILQMMDRMGKDYPPEEITYNGQTLYRLHYGNFQLVNALRRLPYIGVAVMVLFLFIAYVGFRNIKRAEQRYIWVGMAKETAHQLGTPLMSLLGWLERLESISAPDGKGLAPTSGSELGQIAVAMRADVVRLNRVAQRFSQIGSEPDRKVQPLEPVVREVAAYFRARLPHQGKGVAIIEEYAPTESVPINAELIAWVLENLIKNALEAVDPKSGRIEIALTPSSEGGVQISVSDNGRGMTIREQRKIFHAGFTTKKRGWGLGLTLARRIVMEYHGGDLYLDSSIPHEATRFILLLPGNSGKMPATPRP
ncbi:MAG: HAMP domain-containing histidine kinase [candidate division Zixibacteria bacterium]|nr:HAMP domain-containing histidine kinase [candidate division Zixibacteria bacterium]